MSVIGIVSKEWWELLRENRFDVDAPQWKRVTLMSIQSLINARQRRREDRLFADKVAAAEIQPPLFILGHWRSGTTLLQNLLTLDERFAYANQFETSNPHTFLHREPLVVKALENARARKRPMDNVEITFRSPGEDEFALATMTLRSPLIGWNFPRNAAFYDRFLTFRDAAPADVERWKAAMVAFVRKLSFRYGKPLMLKSPPHTARIRLLLEVFPDARFVHVHRDPYTVFKSTQKLFEEAVPFHNFQRMEPGGVTEGILSRYVAMYDAFFEERALIPEGRFADVRFTDLEADPVGVIGRVYEQLGLPAFGEVEAKVREYADANRSYKKNAHPELPEALAERITTLWSRSFEEWGYPTMAVGAA